MNENELTNRISSRRFILAAVFTVTGSVALFFDKVTGEQYYWLAGIVLSAFSLSQFVKSKFER